MYKFNKSGELLKRFGKKGSGLGEFSNPRGVAVAGDRVFVCDWSQSQSSSVDSRAGASQTIRLKRNW